MKASPLSDLEMELITDRTTVGSGKPDEYFREQVPVKDTLSGADTYAQNQDTPTKRTDVELRRMHLDKGADIKGANLNPRDSKGASNFTSDKTA